MLESGKRKPSLKTLEKVSAALGIPFHLFTLLASEPEDVEDADPETLHRLAVGLSKLLLGGGEHEARRGSPGIEKLQILSVNLLADILKIPKETLVKTFDSRRSPSYAPFETLGRSRPFQKEPPTKLRPIDNPREELSWVQKRIYRRLL